MKENQRVLLSKRLLKEALIRLLKQKEISHISITELCAEAGINRATFYRHYDLPRSVLSDIQNDLIQEIRAEIEHSHVDHNMETVVRAVFRYLYTRKELIVLFVKSNAYFDYSDITEMLYTTLLAHQNTLPILDSTNMSDLKLLASFAVGGGYNMVRHWLIDDILRTPDEVADATLAFWKSLLSHFSYESRGL